jgi:hypothetical protein
MSLLLRIRILPRLLQARMLDDYLYLVDHCILEEVDLPRDRLWLKAFWRRKL